jgi:glyoxylase-like metal-dependent hydrolase (beta-lactamase superfamily II)
VKHIRMAGAGLLLLPLLGLLTPAARAAAPEFDAALPELAITRVSEHVFSAIGATAAPSRDNLGHNNNLTFIVTGAGVVVVNGGDNAYLAAALHAAIREHTAEPVVLVINENGQGHAFLGNAYWDALGVPIIAHRDAVAEVRAHGERVLARMRERMGELAAGTRVVIPQPTGDRELRRIGGLRIEVLRFGPAHSPGDVSVWLPDERVLIAGDIAFHERLLGIFPDSDVDGWIESFDALAALEPAVVVPGHGGPTEIGTLRRYTQDYLLFLRTAVREIRDEGGDLNEAYAIDQSAYAHLDTFDELARKNAGRMYRMEEAKLFE